MKKILHNRGKIGKRKNENNQDQEYILKLFVYSVTKQLNPTNPNRTDLNSDIQKKEIQKHVA